MMKATLSRDLFAHHHRCFLMLVHGSDYMRIGFFANLFIRRHDGEPPRVCVRESGDRESWNSVRYSRYRG